MLGPAVNLLPEDRDDLPEVVPVQWLNTTCTLYRREALPEPMFPSNFIGYSLMEDLTLSLTVGRHWKLANARTARIYHDSQRGEHKEDVVAMSTMELVNRHYVMTKVMGKRDFGDYAKLAVWELFQLASCAIDNRGGIAFWRELRGKMLRPLQCPQRPAETWTSMTRQSSANARVVVGIATHNRCDELRKAIASALDQSHASLRVTVIDDASSDGHAEAAR